MYDFNLKSEMCNLILSEYFDLTFYTEEQRGNSKENVSFFQTLWKAQYLRKVNTQAKLIHIISICMLRFVRQCLCLMTAMVSQGTDAACEIFSSLIFNKTLSSLAHMRDRNVSSLRLFLYFCPYRF